MHQMWRDAIKDRDSFHTERDEFKHRLEKIESLLKSLLSEEGMRQQFSCYSVGVELMSMLDGK